MRTTAEIAERSNEASEDDFTTVGLPSCPVCPTDTETTTTMMNTLPVLLFMLSYGVMPEDSHA